MTDDVRVRPLPTVRAFIRRDWTVARSYRLPFFMDLVQPLYTLVFLFYLGHLVDLTKLASAAGVSGGYFGFALLGFAILLIAQTGMSAFTEKIRVEQTSGTIEALLGTSASPSLIILGSAAYDFVWAIVEVCIYVVVGCTVFGFRPDTGVVALAGGAVALTLTIVLSAAAGVCLAGLTMVFKKTGPLVALTTAALSLLGGVYFPVKILPAPFRQVAQLSPLTWAVDLFRAALLDGTFSVARAVLLLAASALAVPASLAFFGYALARVRRSGTLTHF